MTFRKALLLSLLFHIAAILILIRTEFIKPPTKKEEPIIARIIVPEAEKKPLKKELKKPPVPKKKKPETKPPELKKRPSPPPISSARKKPKTKLPLKEKSSPPGTASKPTKKSGLLKEKKPLAEKPASRDRAITEGTTARKTLPSGRELMGREIIQELAKKELKETEKDNAITFDTKELKYYSYMLKLKDRIESIWIYPEEAARRGIFGDLYIQFTIKKDGHLGAIELLRTSGYRELDEAAIRALKDGEPYWPLPESWGVDAITIKGHFIYSLYGTYIR